MHDGGREESAGPLTYLLKTELEYLSDDVQTQFKVAMRRFKESKIALRDEQNVTKELDQHENLVSTGYEADWYPKQKEKLEELDEEEELAERIRATGDIWTHEGACAPGEDGSPEMPAELFEETVQAIVKLQTEVDDATIDLDARLASQQIIDYAQRVISAQVQISQTKELTAIPVGIPATDFSSRPLSTRYTDRSRSSKR